MDFCAWGPYSALLSSVPAALWNRALLWLCPEPERSVGSGVDLSFVVAQCRKSVFAKMSALQHNRHMYAGSPSKMVRTVRLLK